MTQLSIVVKRQLQQQQVKKQELLTQKCTHTHTLQQQHFKLKP